MKNIYLFFLINIIFLSLFQISFCSELPVWVLNPVIDGYELCAAGYAVDNENKSLQKKIARMNAMAELSKMHEVKVTNKLEIEQSHESYNGRSLDSSKKITSTSKQSSSITIGNTKELDSFYDDDTGMYYILLCLK